MSDLAVIFFGACLVNNLILDYQLGIPSALAVTKKIEIAIGMGITMILTLTIASVVSYPLWHYLLQPQGLEYLQIISLSLIITLIILIVEKFLKKFYPGLHEQTSAFVPLTLINTAVLGIALLTIQQSHGLLMSLVYGLGAGTGFALVLVVYSAMEERIAMSDVPEPFQGLAINLITLAFMSMAFIGFTGLAT